MAGRPRLRRLGSPTRHAVATWARERPDLAPEDYQYLVHLMRLGQVIGMLHDRYSRDQFGLGGADIRMLIILRRTQPDHAPNAAELAEAMMITTGAMAKQLDRLERLGLVSRGPSTQERGGIAVYATRRGVEIADQAMTAMVEGPVFSDINQSLSTEDRASLARLCEKMLIDFEER